MNSRTLTLIVLSVILGLGATWMANNWLTARLNTSPDDNQQNVVIATVEIAFGQMIEPQQVTVVRMPRDAAPEDASTPLKKWSARSPPSPCCAATSCAVQGWPSTWVAAPWPR